MASNQYLVNISYIAPYRTGSIGVSQSGVWQTYPTYSTGIYLATMPEIRISATGSTYVGALNALLAVSANADDAAQGPATY